MELTTELMEGLARVAFLPLMLVIMFALFQYLVLTYYRRRREPRGFLLLTCAFLGFATLIPLDHWDPAVVQHLNDISETCSTLTFLLQITIIGSDGNKKIRVRFLRWLTWMAELLILVDLAVVGISFAQLGGSSIDLSALGGLDNVIETTTLLFIFCFRFIYVAKIAGVEDIVRNRKLEVLFYLLFVTHEYPFVAAEGATNVSWEYVQGLYHRTLIVCCLAMTLKTKFKNGKWGPSTVGPGRSTASDFSTVRQWRSAARGVAAATHSAMSSVGPREGAVANVAAVAPLPESNTSSPTKRNVVSMIRQGTKH